MNAKEDGLKNKRKKIKQRIKEIGNKRDEIVETAISAVLDSNNYRSLDEFQNALLLYSIEKSSRSANKLSGRLLCLTWILVIVGIITLGIFIYEQVQQ